jgi:hypothetical protein
VRANIQTNDDSLQRMHISPSPARNRAVFTDRLPTPEIPLPYFFLPAVCYEEKRNH